MTTYIALLLRGINVGGHKRISMADLRDLLDFFVRTAQEWKDVVAHNPFRKEAARDPGHPLVMFLKDAPSVTGVKALRVATGTRP
jgi:uncharacterized protein (DUF1697 family)